ncbi:MAG: dihydrofolate reductase family protein [Oscillospiraceae bacterium]|nr:dihydrofolate reductase family protein [Oscillospiraceae bacterium]
MSRPITTLFLLMSVDGKISTGSTDNMDVDRDFPTVAGLAEGLQQYYDIEQTTDLWSLGSGRVQQKMGVNEGPLPQKTPVSFALFDNSHLTERGVRHFCARSQQFVLITDNEQHPAFSVAADNLHIILHPKSFADALQQLNTRFGCERITVQTGGTLNTLLVREKLIDYVDIVVAPVLIGGKDTATLMDGASLSDASQLSSLGVLQLERCEALQNSYVRLRYKVVS